MGMLLLFSKYLMYLETMFNLHTSLVIMGRLIILILLISVARSCPPMEDIAPFCKCETGFSGDNILTCDDLLSPDQLRSPLNTISKQNIKLYSLTIEDSSLMYIPNDVFKDTSIENIRFMKSEIMSLSDSDVAFEGLENTLKEIRAREANYIAQWDWEQLRNLKSLNLIDVNWISLGSIDVPFPRLPQLTALGITRAEISFIVDSAFANLPKLQIFNIKDNQITELKRNMFPDPAQELFILDLSGNEISHLPGDFFSNMPSLSEVHLDKNKFVTLTENPFMQALNEIREITMTENPFRCDCRMQWIVNVPARHLLHAQCTAPESLSGKQLTELDIKYLWCYFAQ